MDRYTEAIRRQQTVKLRQYRAEQRVERERRRQETNVTTKSVTPKNLAEKETTLTTNDLEILAYHLSVLYREHGTGGLSRPDGTSIPYEITPAGEQWDDDIWASVTLDGHSVGNRHGAANAYVRFWAGESEWWRAR